ncbi:MAG: hypothetical protein IT322_04960 [Anaerolineae bacterium]|nr:hypothetical protein [Anaerolineae bacterium]
MPPTLTRREWFSLLLFAAAVMMITSLPYLIGSQAARPGEHYTGLLLGIEDANSYLAKMRLGANGAWLFTMRYTAESHTPALLFTPYLLIGKIAGLIAPPTSPAHYDALLMVFHGVRFLSGMLVIVVSYRFLAAFVRVRALRWLGAVLVSLGGGLGWLLVSTGNGNYLGWTPVDLLLPEGYTFYLLYGLPHLALARAGLLVGLLCLFQSARCFRPDQWLRWSMVAGACWLVMAVCVPFYGAVLALILGAWGLGVWLRRGRFPLDLIWRCAVGGILPGIMLLYSLLVTATEPVLKATFQDQNLLTSPPPIHFLFGYGLLTLAALPAFPCVWQRGKKDIRWILPLSWLIIAPVLAYFPIEVQRRMLEGVFVPLCLMSVIGLRLWWIALRRVTQRRAGWVWRALALGIAAISLGTPIMTMLAGAFAPYNEQNRPQFNVSAGAVAMFEWLNTNTSPDQVALSATRAFSNRIPAWTNLRSYLGHPVETLDALTKEAEVKAFYEGRMEAPERQSFFAQRGIRYWLFTPDDPPPPDDLIPVYVNEAGYRVFKVGK